MRRTSGSVESVLGYSAAERIGRKAFETVHREDADALNVYFQTFGASDRIESADFRFRHKNGSTRVLELSGANLLVAMAGLSVVGIPFLTVMGLCAAAAVFVAVASPGP